MMATQTKNVSTTTLWARLFRAPSATTYLDANAGELGLPTFAEYATALCRARGEVVERIIKRSGLERCFGHQLFRGVRRPSRDSVLMLAFGFEADVELAQTLLRHARHSQLYPRIQRDAIISYCLQHGYSLMDAQQMLMDLSLPLIGGEPK